jgi:hypothetical protein
MERLIPPAAGRANLAICPTFIHRDYAATTYTLNSTTVKFFLKFLLVVMFFQAGWFPALAHSEHVHDASAVVIAEDAHRAEKVISLYEHDHDCENCLQQCHSSSAILDKSIASQPLADASCLISLAPRPIGCAPPSKIERPKWMATTA